MIGLYFHSFELFVDCNFAEVTIAKNPFFYSVCMGKQGTHFFFHKQSIFDPRPENCLRFSKKSPRKIV